MREAEFWEHVDKSAGPTGCWPWTGPVNERRGGYGILRWEGKTSTAHRVAWMLANGRAPLPGLHVCHECDNPVCCNPGPGHLYEGTAAQNNQDISDHGRAWWQTATHCRNNHEWTPENTILGHWKGKPTVRRCRTCHEAQKARNLAKWHAKRKAALLAVGRR